VEEARPVTLPDFDRMTKDEILDWFDNAEDLSPLVKTMLPDTEEVRRSSNPPMMLASIRLPVEMVFRIDEYAQSDGVTRSDLVRDAIAAYLADRTKDVSRDEAEQALAVISRIVHERTGSADAV
jgi:Arc/MetJ-type ribon-helix-helix transcriptional regulator